MCDLGAARWPFDDSTVDEAVASHVLEHLPGESFFHFIRELYRVLKPGGKAAVVVPHPRHDIFLNDPTHYRPVTTQTLLLFSGAHVRDNAENGRILTPFYKLHGVDFNVLRAWYMVDASLEPELLKKVEANLRFYERHYNNIVFEIQIEMEAVK